MVETRAHAISDADQEEQQPADTRDIRRKYLDIPYTHQSPEQMLDVYLPEEGEGPFPVLMHIQ